MPQAIGLIETRGMIALVEGTDAMLKAANVELAGPMTQVGNALVTAVVVGDVADVKAATDAGAQAIKAIKGEVVSVHVIARPHADVDADDLAFDGFDRLRAGIGGGFDGG